MKAFTFVLASLVLTTAIASSGAEARPIANPLSTIIDCYEQEFIADRTVSLRIKSARFGGYREAQVTLGNKLGRHVETFRSVQSEPLLVEGDIAVGTIYSSQETESELQSFELTIDFRKREGRTGPADLVLGGRLHRMVCESLPVLH